MAETLLTALLVFSVGLSTSVAYKGSGGRIVGGDEARIEDFPYHAQIGWLRNDKWSYTCGAAIIGPKSVITAGHCMERDQADQERIRVGSNKIGEGNLHNITYVEHHDNFVIGPNNAYADYDIAFAVVEPPFIFDDSTQPIPIAEVEPVADEMGVATGWGYKEEMSSKFPEILQKVDIPIVDRDECAENYTTMAPIGETMICAGYPEGGRETCQGDSGGPYVVNGKLTGVVSFALGCAKPGYPGVMANVAHFASWIRKCQEEYDP